ncbi:MAG: hypothetical protein AB7L90_22075 [Hyphomicrobiaceae bacterium]
MQMIIAHSPSIAPGPITSALAAAGWTMTPPGEPAAAGERHARLVLLAETASAPELLADAVAGRTIVVFRPIEDEAALAIATGMSAEAALAAAGDLVRAALAAYRRNRRRVTLVAVNERPGGRALLAEAIGAPIVEGSEGVAIDPVLRELAQRLFSYDDALLEDLAELEASISLGERRTALGLPSVEAAIAAWRAMVDRVRSAGTDAERAAEREEITLLRDQLRVSQDAIEELALSLDKLGAGISRRPRIASGRLIESVDLSASSSKDGRA